MSKGTWMILSYFANVDAMAPSIHIDYRVQELRKRGHRVIVITSFSSPHGCKDTWRIPSILPSGIRYEVRKILFRRRQTIINKIIKGLVMLPILPFYALEKLFFPFDANWSWYLSAQWSALRLAKRYKPDIIYSTGGPVTAHVAAERVCRKTGIPWLAEFQDPLRIGSSTRNRRESKLHQRTEELVATKADFVIYLTKALRESTILRRSFKGVVKAIYAGAPVPEESARHTLADDGKKIKIVHIGTMSATRNFLGLIDVFQLLEKEYEGVFDRVEFHQYGHADKRVVESSRKHPSHIHLMGKVSHVDAIDIMAQADVLLLIQDVSHISIETIPSKVYEYLHTGRPILGLLYRNPELKLLLENHGHVVAQVDDPAAIALAIKNLFESWELGSLHDGILPSPFSIANSVNEMEELTGSLLKNMNDES